MPFPHSFTPQSDEIPFHGEPRHHYSFWFLLNVGKPSHKTFTYFYARQPGVVAAKQVPKLGILAIKVS